MLRVDEGRRRLGEESPDRTQPAAGGAHSEEVLHGGERAGRPGVDRDDRADKGGRHVQRRQGHTAVELRSQMYRELYPHVTDAQVEGWHPIFKINNKLIVMAKHEVKNTIYALLYKHTFSFVTPRQLLESEIFNIRYKSLNDVHTVAEKLRYYRYKKALRQKDVAKQIGVSASTYMSYEDVNRGHYSVEVLKRIAAFYKVNETEIMDEYHSFLYCGQGLQLKRLINDLNLTPKAVAKKLNVHAKTVVAWESEKVRISKSMYIKIFEDNILSQS